MDMLLLVGDGPVCDVLQPMAQLLGWQVRASAEVPETLAEARAIIVTSHDVEVAGPTLHAAIESGLDYIGAMGSRPAQAERRQWLLEHGVSEQAQGAIHGPAGLDIGADAPPEIALSILAELINVLRGGRVGALRDREGAIHPDLAPGEAICPAG